MRTLSVFAILLLSTFMVYARDWSAAAGKEQAQRDIAAGRIRICWGGTIAYGPCGVHYGTPDEALAKRLPKLPLPTGCTTREAAEASEFGVAYNKVMLAYVRKHPKT